MSASAHHFDDIAAQKKILYKLKILVQIGVAAQLLSEHTPKGFEKSQIGQLFSLNFTQGSGVNPHLLIHNQWKRGDTYEAVNSSIGC
jgi:hypothetical protein